MFGIDHILSQRPRQQPQPQVQPSVSRMNSSFPNPFSGNTASSSMAIVQSSTPLNPMPLLPLHGFINAVVVDIHQNPNGCLFLNRALRFYQLPIWEERGDVPRSLIPDFSPEAIQSPNNTAAGQATQSVHTTVRMNQMGNEIFNEQLDNIVANASGGRVVYRRL